MKWEYKVICLATPVKMFQSETTDSGLIVFKYALIYFSEITQKTSILSGR